MPTATCTATYAKGNLVIDLVTVRWVVWVVLAAQTTGILPGTIEEQLDVFVTLIPLAENVEHRRRQDRARRPPCIIRKGLCRSPDASVPSDSVEDVGQDLNLLLCGSVRVVSSDDVATLSLLVDPVGVGEESVALDELGADKFWGMWPVTETEPILRAEKACPLDDRTGLLQAGSPHSDLDSESSKADGVLASETVNHTKGRADLIADTSQRLWDARLETAVE